MCSVMSEVQACEAHCCEGCANAHVSVLGGVGGEDGGGGCTYTQERVGV